MYITVITLILLEVSSEWVEITQQSYRKPINSQIRKPEESIYSNQTILDNNWKNSIHKSHSANIKLLKVPASNFHQSSTGGTFTIETIDTSEGSDEFGFNEKMPIINRDYGVIQKVSNLGSVERVQLPKSPVRSPISRYSEATIPSNNPVGFQKVKKIINPFQYKGDNHFETDLIQDKAVRLNKIKVGDNVEHRILSTQPKTPSNNNVSRPNTFIRSTLTPPTTTNFKNLHSTNYFKNKQQSNIFITAKGNHDMHKSTINISHDKIIENKASTIPTFDVTNEFENKKDEESAKLNNTNIQNENPTNKLSSIPEEHKSNNTRDKVFVNETQDNAMENVMKFINVVADTISKNTKRSVESKMRYLEDLKETILANIGEYMRSKFLLLCTLLFMSNT